MPASFRMIFDKRQNSTPSGLANRKPVWHQLRIDNYFAHHPTY
jgi:hypothetical protein